MRFWHKTEFKKYTNQSLVEFINGMHLEQEHDRKEQLQCLPKRASVDRTVGKWNCLQRTADSRSIGLLYLEAVATSK